MGTALRHPLTFDQIVGASAAWQGVLGLIQRVARSRATVLLLGETGTGKEMLARALHLASDRADGPFVRVNCGALSGALLESELFGHVRGAFTGAIEDKMGRFEAANFGTLFLDEIGTLELALQVKLLRVLQEREFERVGSSRTISVDVRIVAATNLDLQHEVTERRFREDLFYRLNVITVNLPPLRERVEDIPALVEHFIDKYNEQNRKNLGPPVPATLQAMTSYEWPGNVRELENICERAVVLSDDAAFTPELLPAPMMKAIQTRRLTQSPPASDGWATLLEQAAQAGLRDGNIQDGHIYNELVGKLEEYLIRTALTRCGGVKLRAADFLGLNRNTLHKKCQDYAIDAPAPEPELGNGASNLTPSSSADAELKERTA